ncbi:lactate utilization protein C [Paenibacillus yanchengensis]|uniref:Lactate utilization protein C n=1 Tax=Paenibacillus yanchengensis TaxID=2035833 RepID=A0ABW4YNS8_9BACL
MSEQHAAWLARMEQQSKAKQAQFMNHIAGRLGHPRMTEKPEQPYRGAPSFWEQFNWTQTEKEEQFMKTFQSVGGHTAKFSTLEQANEFIVQHCEELGAKYIVQHNDAYLLESELNKRLADKLPEAQISIWNTDQEKQWIKEAAQADVGIVVADYAVAYTGSIVTLSAANKGRSASLLPTVMYFIVPIDRLHTRLGEVLNQFDELEREQLPAGIHFISGPSRSSDIENDLTIGVHGPGVVYALLVG